MTYTKLRLRAEPGSIVSTLQRLCRSKTCPAGLLDRTAIHTIDHGSDFARSTRERFIGGPSYVGQVGTLRPSNKCARFSLLLFR